MKKIIIIFIILTAVFAGSEIQAQVAIGKQTITNQSVLLEFNADPKGILLPSVPSAPGAVGGTFVFNTTSKSVQVFQDTSWTDLTDVNQGIAHSFSNAGSDIGSGVIIGANTTTKSGALILESTTKAMVLPQVVNPHLAIRGAIAGTMVYDTVSDTLAVYDGANWSYWR